MFLVQKFFIKIFFDDLYHLLIFLIKLIKIKEENNFFKLIILNFSGLSNIDCVDYY